jgi:quinol monooxygenase YgiN
MSNQKIGFIVHFHLKPESIEQWLNTSQEVVTAMAVEPTFVNFFRLQDRTNPSRFVLYETWNCTKDVFLNVEMKRPYRAGYERQVPSLVVDPRRMEFQWQLIRSATKAAEAVTDREKLGFFVCFQTKPGQEQIFRRYLDPVLDAMSHEESFLDYFLLQDETNSTKFVIYETWYGNEAEFRATQLERPYRRPYEEHLPAILAKPREVEYNWKLLQRVAR